MTEQRKASARVKVFQTPIPTAPKPAIKVRLKCRTFWEKVTILHAWYHTPSHKKFRDRQSRHYYDVVRLYEQGIGQRAMTDLTLLQQVAQHKSVFFALASARYEEAKPGTLHLAPPEARIPELEEDYRKMREMIFGDVPGFDHLLTTLTNIEAEVNTPK